MPADNVTLGKVPLASDRQSLRLPPSVTYKQLVDKVNELSNLVTYLQAKDAAQDATLADHETRIDVLEP